MFSFLDFINTEVLSGKEPFRKNYMNHVILGQYSNSTNNDKEECLKALVVRLLIIALAHQSLFSFHTK